MSEFEAEAARLENSRLLLQPRKGGIMMINLCIKSFYFAKRTAFLLAAFALPLYGCRPFTQSGAESEIETVFFANGRLRSTNVSVCWEFASSSTSEFRSQLESTVKTAFAKTKLRFSGWAKCASTVSSSDFRIFIYDDPGSDANSQFQNLRSLVVSRNNAFRDFPGHPRVDVSLSDKAWVRGKKAGIILSLSGKDAHPDFTNIYEKLSVAGRKNLMVSSSLHEFGHAIGMRHEDAHSQNKCAAFDENLAPGDVQIGPWNPTSFMERCFYRNFDYEKGIVWPNGLDIAGLNKMYP
jgi:hypothetical protein